MAALLSGEEIEGLIGNGFRPDIRAKNICLYQSNKYELSFTDVHKCIVDICEKSMKKHENEKKRQYNKCIVDMENGTFTPSVFSFSGGIGAECYNVAKIIAVKTEECYEKILSIVIVLS